MVRHIKIEDKIKQLKSSKFLYFYDIKIFHFSKRKMMEYT